MENGDETGSERRQCLGMNDTREALLVVTDQVVVIIQGEQKHSGLSKIHVVSKKPSVATAVCGFAITQGTRLCNSRPPFSIYLLSFSPFSFHLSLSYLLSRLLPSPYYIYRFYLFIYLFSFFLPSLYSIHTHRVSLPGDNTQHEEGGVGGMRVAGWAG